MRSGMQDKLLLLFSLFSKQRAISEEAGLRMSYKTEGWGLKAFRCDSE